MATDDLARLLNVFDENSRRRAEEAREAAPDRESLLKSLLHILDSIDRLCDADQAISPKSLAALRLQFEEILAANGTVPISTQNRVFDPDLHTATRRQHDNQSPEGAILEEESRGWLCHGEVLRPARVVVSTSDPNA